MIATYLPWLLSVLTITVNIMAGDNRLRTWDLALFNTGLWLVWIVATDNYGFLPMTLALGVIFTRNLIKRRGIRIWTPAKWRTS